MTPIELGDERLGGLDRLFFIAGPCVIESEEHAVRLGQALAALLRPLGCAYIFKASYDKANRTAIGSFRGPGQTEGLRILTRVREEVGVPVLTDVHSPQEAEAAAEAGLDVIQIPAFLSRQTDLLLAAGRTGRVVNIKKGQFLSPWDMAHAVDKVRSTGNHRLFLTERGFSFGYQNLVVDFRGLPVMRQLGVPVVFDATHSVQLPGGAGGRSGGNAEFIEPLARAAVACGVDGVFFEVHDDPANALCDGPNALPLNQFEQVVRRLLAIRAAAHDPAGESIP